MTKERERREKKNSEKKGGSEGEESPGLGVENGKRNGKNNKEEVQGMNPQEREDTKMVLKRNGSQQAGGSQDSLRPPQVP